MARREKRALVAASVEGIIREIRGQKAILDSDLAALYGVTTGRFNEAVGRNVRRFPKDFRFVLTHQEFANLKSQIAISSWGGRRKLPSAFTEHGAIMAANVLNSDKATEMSVYVVRAFVRMRQTLAASAVLARRVEAVERRLDTHDESIRALVTAVRQLMLPPEKPRRIIGFKPR
jgi:hypothetical protein